MHVRMSGLACAGGHEFFDNAAVGCFDEVPAIAVGSLRTAPFVVFGRSYADYLCRHANTFAEINRFNNRFTTTACTRWDSCTLRVPTEVIADRTASPMDPDPRRKSRQPYCVSLKVSIAHNFHCNANLKTLKTRVE
jgi:hypothetical protein